MNIFRMVMAVVLPPLAVWDKGCGTVILVTLLTLLFWIPGTIAAMYFVVRDMQRLSLPLEERNRAVFRAAQSFKSQPLAAPQPFHTQTAAPANSLDKPDNNLPAPPPARPKPPWES